jgi:hypothetical protein
MTHVTWPDGADVLARVGRHWGWMMAFGIRARSAGRRIEDRELHPV